MSVVYVRTPTYFPFFVRKHSTHSDRHRSHDMAASCFTSCNILDTHRHTHKLWHFKLSWHFQTHFLYQRVALIHFLLTLCCLDTLLVRTTNTTNTMTNTMQDNTGKHTTTHSFKLWTGRPSSRPEPTEGPSHTPNPPALPGSHLLLIRAAVPQGFITPMNCGTHFTVNQCLTVDNSNVTVWHFSGMK